MKFILFLIALALIACSNSGIRKYPNGQLVQQGFRENGVEGVDKFYPSGALMEHNEFHGADRSNSTITTYYENGSMECKGSFAKGIQQGDFLCYFPSGALHVSVSEDGHVKQFYESGILLQEYFIENGKVEGDFISNYPDGRLQYRCKYENDHEISRETFYKDGQIKTESKESNGSNSNNQKTRPNIHVSYSFHSNGMLARKAIFIAGRSVGKEFSYSLNGKISAERIFAFSVQQGFQREYYRNGNLRNDFVIYLSESGNHYDTYYHKLFDEDGNLKYYKDSLTEKFFYENGNLKSLKDSTGEYSYNEDGSLKKEIVNGIVHWIDRDWNDSSKICESWKDSLNNEYKGKCTNAKGAIISEFFEKGRIDNATVPIQKKRIYSDNGILIFSSEKQDSLVKETDFYESGKLWIQKEYYLEGYRRKLIYFKEYSEDEITIRDYQVIEVDGVRKAICHFKDFEGNDVEVPPRRRNRPFSMQDEVNGCIRKERPKYEYVDKCEVY